MSTPPPGWYPDPSGAHEQRRWDGADWTEDVHDAGRTTLDPLAARTPRPAGFYPDTEGRYEERRWDGRAWTREVRNGGEPKRGSRLAILAGVLAVTLPVGGCGYLVAVADVGPGANDDCTGIYIGQAGQYVDEHPPPDGVDADQLAEDLERACLIASEEDAGLTFEEAWRGALAEQSGGGEAF